MPTPGGCWTHTRPPRRRRTAGLTSAMRRDHVRGSTIASLGTRRTVHALSERAPLDASGGPLRGALVIALMLLVLTACGSNVRVRIPERHARSSAPTAYGVPPAALVTMRQFSPESLLWQTVSLQTSGRGLLTTLIGEISGAVQKPFRLTGRQVTALRRLVTGARDRCPRHPAATLAPSSTRCTSPASRRRTSRGPNRSRSRSSFGS